MNEVAKAVVERAGNDVRVRGKRVVEGRGLGSGLKGESAPADGGEAECDKAECEVGRRGAQSANLHGDASVQGEAKTTTTAQM